MDQMSCICHLLAMWSLANDFAFQNLDFLAYIVRPIIPSLQEIMRIR